jgi:diguanylate cyclase (GGDEF)-like protein/PAS domain S-box-containing protein
VQKLLNRLAYLPAIFAVVAVTAAWRVVETQSVQSHTQHTRDDIAVQADEVRAKIEGGLSSDLQLAQGLASALAIEPDMSQERFSALAERVFSQSEYLEFVVAAQEASVLLAYPNTPAARELRLNYGSISNDLAEIIQASKVGQMVLSKPMSKASGGTGMIARYPIFDTTDPVRPLWGALAVMINLDAVYSASGIDDPNMDLDLALASPRFQSPENPNGLIYGSDEVLDAHPVSKEIRLPSETWSLFAVPRVGWEHAGHSPWQISFAFLLAGIMIVAPLTVSAYLIRQRHAYIEVLSRQKTDLDNQSRRLQLALEAAGTGVWEFDTETRTVHWDRRMNEIYGLDPETTDRSYDDWAERVHPEDRENAIAEFSAGIKSKQPFRSFFRVQRPDGVIRHVSALGNVVQLKNQTKVIGVNWDISAETELQKTIELKNQGLKEKNFELELAKKRVEFLAHHDPLTELPNRRYLDTVMNKHIKENANNLSYAGVLQIDLDGFKKVNDTLGHHAGDKILVKVGAILKRLIDGRGLVFRVGGDEFVVFLSMPDARYFSEEGNLQTLATRIQDALAPPFSLPDGQAYIGASIGIATDAFSTTTSRSMLRDADVALYEAKVTGRGRYVVCDSTLRRELDRKNQFSSEIEVALDEGQIIPHYQLQFSGKDLSVFGVEALARWHHPTRGILRPHDFIEQAKAIGKDADIDRAILVACLKDREEWLKRGVTVPRISVNVSARQISDSNILDELTKLNIPPQAISFELLESIFMDDGNRTLTANVAGLKKMGIDIEIDDFGTGFASIVALLKLSPKRLKIDGQLVAPMKTSKAARNVAAAMIEIGSSLGIEVIAEGVESEWHIDALSKMGCHGLQGYALSRPLSSELLCQELVDGPKRRAASI